MEKVYIIAEAGVNHNGNLSLAKKLIDVAFESGADAIKFQTFNTDKTIKKDSKLAEYQKNNLGYETTQYEMVKKLELSEADHFELMDYCNKIGIEFMSTPFDIDSVDLLDKLGVKRFKVGSGEITNYELLKHLAKKNKPIIISTGMSTLSEIDDAVRYLESLGVIDLSILHCISNYPPKLEEINLNFINTLKTIYNYPIGYSDHTSGIEISLAAVALGSKIIEKHITLDKNMDGPDHLISLNPTELSDLVISIRNVEIAMGSNYKRILEGEQKVKDIARKSLVFTSNLQEGHKISEKDLTFKRPGIGIYPSKIDLFIGKKLTRGILKDDILSYKDFMIQ